MLLRSRMLRRRRSCGPAGCPEATTTTSRRRPSTWRAAESARPTGSCRVCATARTSATSSGPSSNGRCTMLGSMSRSARCASAVAAADGLGDSALDVPVDGVRLLDLHRAGELDATIDGLALPANEKGDLVDLLGALESTFDAVDDVTTFEMVHHLVVGNLDRAAAVVDGMGPNGGRPPELTGVRTPRDALTVDTRALVLIDASSSSRAAAGPAARVTASTRRSTPGPPLSCHRPPTSVGWPRRPRATPSNCGSTRWRSRRSTRACSPATTRPRSRRRFAALPSWPTRSTHSEPIARARAAPRRSPSPSSSCSLSS